MIAACSPAPEVSPGASTACRRRRSRRSSQRPSPRTFPTRIRTATSSPAGPLCCTTPSCTGVGWHRSPITTSSTSGHPVLAKKDPTAPGSQAMDFDWAGNQAAVEAVANVRLAHRTRPMGHQGCRRSRARSHSAATDRCPCASTRRGPNTQEPVTRTSHRATPVWWGLRRPIFRRKPGSRSVSPPTVNQAHQWVAGAQAMRCRQIQSSPMRWPMSTLSGSSNHWVWSPSAVAIRSDATTSASMVEVKASSFL